MPWDPMKAWLWRFDNRARLIRPLAYKPFEELNFDEPVGTLVLILLWDESVTATAIALAVQCTADSRVLLEVDTELDQKLAVAELGPRSIVERDAIGALVLWWARAKVNEGMPSPSHFEVESMLDVATTGALLRAAWTGEVVR